MLPSLLLSLREGLEAALIIGIVISVLNRFNRDDLKSVVWQGTAAAVVLSLLIGLGLQALGMRFEGRAEEIFEGIATLFAAGVLTWMIFWCVNRRLILRNICMHRYNLHLEVVHYLDY